MRSTRPAAWHSPRPGRSTVCPDDEKVYIDLSFYDELKRRFGAPGDFAQAYVLAHEIRHHVQKLRAMGTHPGERNELSVRLELQADCLAGVWGNSTAQRNILEAGDVEGSLARRFGCRGRPPSADGDWTGEPGFVHTRKFRTAGALVPRRISGRKHRGMRHLFAVAGR
jgi:hypothetical protein